MDFSDDVFGGLYEPFAGLNEMDFKLHGIYMDHEPHNDFLSHLNKCKDSFLNVLLSDDNLRNSSIADEVRAQVYHVGDWKSDEEVIEDREKVKKKHIIHDRNTIWDLMEPKLGDMFESMAQLKFCMQNYAMTNEYGLYYEKCIPPPPNTRRFFSGDKGSGSRLLHLSLLLFKETDDAFSTGSLLLLLRFCFFTLNTPSSALVVAVWTWGIGVSGEGTKARGYSTFSLKLKVFEATKNGWRIMVEPVWIMSYFDELELKIPFK
ncbi:unnamed protein product [Lactuca virosa]|uniref:Uncharacterized protein n=1 Tax=Lactuca virosa TaxID=75947 RepID=A0AAU9PE87_9ASTR|nr:unnamed protein product [Lactuca virosa]